MNARPALQGVVASFGGAFLLLAFRAPLGVTLGMLVVKRPVGSLALFASPVGHATALIAEDTEFSVVRRTNVTASPLHQLFKSRRCATPFFETPTPPPIGTSLPMLIGQLDVVSEFDVFAIGMIFENGESLALVRQPDCAPRFIYARHPVVFGLQGVPRGERCPDFPDAGPVEKVLATRGDVFASKALCIGVVQWAYEEQNHE